MNFSTQLRLILLIAGGVALLLIYLLGKRHGRAAERAEQSSRSALPAVQDFGSGSDLDEDELDTPAYLRRSQHEVRHRDEALPAVTLAEVDEDWPEATGDSSQHIDQFDTDDESQAADEQQDDEQYEDAPSSSVMTIEPELQAAPLVVTDRAEPTFDEHSLGSFVVDHDEPVVHEAMAPVAAAVPVVTQTHDAVLPIEPPTIPAIHSEPVAPVLQHAVTAPVAEESKPAAKPVAAVESQAKPAPAFNKRKIVALRLSLPQRVAGEQLLSLLQRENLQHGRFDIFHRLHEETSVFSVASMVEPGSFDLSTMRDQQYPGVTFFMLLPGPLDGLVAWDQMLSCAQRLAHAAQGVLQDERGHKLTSMATDRLREEVLDFQHLLGSVDVVTQ